MYDTAKSEFRLTHRVELGLSFFLRYLALGCLFASSLEVALKLAGYAVIAYFEAASQVSARSRAVAKESEQRLAWLDQLTLQNILRKMKDGKAENWNEACEIARKEAVEDIQIHREREENEDKYFGAKGGFAASITAGGLVFLVLDLAAAISCGWLVRQAGAYLAPYWPAWIYL